MAKRKAGSELPRLLRDLREKPDGTVSVGEVADIVERLMTTLKADPAVSRRKIFTELKGLAQFIRTTKDEIALLSPDDVKHEYLPKAADELDAIVAATADATNAIMDATEIIEAAMSGVEGETRDQLLDATTRIYEACGFQDITGQRITKVFGSLKEIETRIDALLTAFGGDVTTGKPIKALKTKKKTDKKVLTDEDLLVGPQKVGEANTQEDIDKLFASFD
jgi:chemotaxis protein CheZ